MMSYHQLPICTNFLLNQHVVAGEVAHTIPCHGTGYALAWNPRNMLLAYCGREEKADRSSGAGYVNVFAPGMK